MTQITLPTHNTADAQSAVNPPILRGQLLRMLPQFQETAEELFLWVAESDAVGGRVEIRAITTKAQFPVSVETGMVAAVNTPVATILAAGEMLDTLKSIVATSPGDCADESEWIHGTQKNAIRVITLAEGRL